MAAADEPSADALDPMVAELLRGPLDTFVARRDALVKELKADGRTDESAAVKKLRKPSRPAWALDVAVAEDPDTVEQVAGAVQEVVDAQAGRGDMRTAGRALRDAVNGAAGAAATAAKDAGVKLDRADLVPAVMAVVADAEAFDKLRRGLLGEIPAAGGLDVLTNPAPLTVAPRAGAGRPAPAPAEPADDAAVQRARDAVTDAESAAGAAHDEADSAERGVDDAQAELEAAEQALHQAELDARHASDRLRVAKRAAKVARDAARDADRVAAKARANLAEIER